MTKTELIDKTAEASDLSKKDAGRAVDAIFEAISETLHAGERVQLIGFGSFEVRDRPERRGRNPQTGVEIIIPARKTAVFRPGRGLRDRVDPEGAARDADSE